jgi:hypothetical protein
MKKKPIKILKERKDYHYIEISIFKTAKAYSFSVSTSIGDGVSGTPTSAHTVHILK